MDMCDNNRNSSDEQMKSALREMMQMDTPKYDAIKKIVDFPINKR